jgi:tetratricopeptide (TPR) repeat protein
MKTLMITIGFLFACVASGWTQIQSPIKEETRANSLGSYNALVMELPGVSDKEANKQWSKYVGKFKGKTKYERKANEYFSDDATIKEMSDNAVDIIAKIEARGDNGSVIYVWFNLGVTYLSSKDYPDRYPAGEKVLKDFAREVSADMIQAEMDEAAKRLKELEELLKKQEKDEAQLIKDIEDYKAAIRKAEEGITKAEGDIKKSEEDQGNSKLSIEEQKKIIADIQKRLDSVK